MKAIPGQIVVAMLIGAPAALGAQTPDFSSVGTAVSGITTPMVLNPCPGGRCQGTARTAPGGPARTGTPTRFTRDPARFRAKQQQVIAAGQAKDPKLGEALQQLFAQDILAKLEPAFRATGLDSSDMADMMTVYWINAWEGANGIAGRKPDSAIVRAARGQIASTMARNPAVAQMTDAQKQDLADTMIIEGVLVELRVEGAAKQGPDALRQASDMIAQEAQQITKVNMRAVTLSAAGFRPKAPAAGATPPPVASQSPGAAMAASAGGHAGNWAQVEGVYFRSITTFGVGGMMIQQFQPLVLFRDGSYYKIEGPALEDIDLATARAAKPTRWGRWQKSGAGFLLTNDKGTFANARPLMLGTGQFFKAYPAEAGGNRLARKYNRVFGGGNTALGGTTMIGFQTDIQFAPDGSYGRATGGGASNISDGYNVNNATGVSVATSSHSAGAGRYKIAKYTIAMTQPDGSAKRQFFAFGGQNKPPSADTDMLFIGENVYTVMHNR